MGRTDQLSIRARLRISILTLVTAVVFALSLLHLYGVLERTFAEVGDRATTLAGQVNSVIIETVRRNSGPWQEVVSRDPLISRLLQTTLARSSAIVDVVVLDSSNRILAAADPARVGGAAGPARPWDQWSPRGLFWRTYDIFESNRDLAVDSHIVATGTTTPLMTVRVLLSPALMRSAIEPQLERLLLISTLALVVSALLAIFVSRLVGDSLERISRKIDSIAEGDLRAAEEDRFHAPELSDIETKLWWLGRQYTGARSDASHLRHNVEQMLRQFEEAVLIFGPDGRLQIAGEAAERLLAKPRSEMAGRTLSELFPPWTGAGATVDRAAKSGKRLRDEAVTIERPNMSPANVLLTLESVVYEDNSGTGTLIALKDADSRRKLRADLDTADRLMALSRITSGVAHEIKNPLNAMMLHLEVAREALKAGGMPQAELEIIKRELVRLDRVVKALLEFHRPVPMRLANCDLRGVTADVVALIQPQAATQNIAIETQGEQPAGICCDGDLLRQAILNVAVNAIEAMPGGGSLRFVVAEDDSLSTLSIEDTGPGIPPENHDKLFNLYFTTKPSGTGAGLAMTYRILQLHSGNVVVSSEPGKGTCFRLELPRKQLTEVAA